MIELIAIGTSITATAIALPIKAYRMLKHKREDAANRVLSDYDEHMCHGEDIEEFLDAQHLEYKRIDVEKQLKEDYVSEDGNDDLEVEDTQSVIERDDLERLFGHLEVPTRLGPVCEYARYHYYYIYCPMCQQKISLEDEISHLDVEKDLIFDIEQHNESVRARDIEFRTKNLRSLHSEKLVALFTDILKAKYMYLDDTKANRMVLRDHLVQWYERRAEKEKDIRRMDVIRNGSIAIECFFIPTRFDIIAAQVGDCSVARERYFQASNPSFIQRAAYKIDSGLWSLLFRKRTGASRQ